MTTALHHSVISRLRKDLVDGRFNRGEALGIAPLSDLYGVSAIPLREALSALLAEGLVDYVPRRGYQAISPDYVSILDHLDFLQMLLIESAFYWASSKARRRSVLRSMNRHFPSSATTFSTMSPFEASSSLAQVFQESGRTPHSQVFERSLLLLASVLHANIVNNDGLAAFHNLVRNYFRTIAINLPELCEMGVKRAIGGFRSRLLDTLTLRA